MRVKNQSRPEMKPQDNAYKARVVDAAYHSPPDNQCRITCHLCQKTAFIDQPLLVSRWLMNNVSHCCSIARMPAHLGPRDVRENNHFPLQMMDMVQKLQSLAGMGGIAANGNSMLCSPVRQHVGEMRKHHDWAPTYKTKRNISYNFYNNKFIYVPDLIEKNLTKGIQIGK